jgi:hypothetical protein
LDRSKFGANLNPFEINLIRFENRIGRTVLPTPSVSAAPTASPCCPVPHQPTDNRDPVASRPTCQPRRLASHRPRRSPLSRDNVPLVRAAVGPLLRRCHPAALLHTVLGPLSLSRSTSTRRPPLRPPPHRFPLKRSCRPKKFSHPTRRSSRPSTPERRAFVPIAQASSSPVFRHRSPSSVPDSVHASPPSAPPLW